MDSQQSALVIAGLLSLVILLSVLLFRQNRETVNLLHRMIQERELTNQTLLNQLRTQDPYTLLSLNAATGVQTPLSTSEPIAYVPMGDSAEFARFSQGVGDDLTQADLEAFGTYHYDDAER